MHSWFMQYTTNPQIEIEARIRDVKQMGFEAVLAHLKSNTQWSNTPEMRETLDLVHVSGVRETRGTGTRSFLRKNKINHVEFQGSPAHAVRIAVAEELPCGEDESPVQTYRFKRRITFVHKGMFAFELTQVRSGWSEQEARSSPIMHEIEIEFCGQKLRPSPNPQYLADSMLMKLKDLVNRLGKAAAGPALQPPGKRPKLADSAMQEGQPVSVKPGSAVALESAGHGQPPPFDGEMPTELASQMPWLLSHIEEGPKGAKLAFIMSLPMAIGRRSYPLFYFYGSVPVDEVSAKS
uniref:mRNA 5'-phosphatase n=1 Tax=Coccolithus braarudii TaxID=221442 RepID=A0A7S0L938_9EUKA